MIDKSTDRLRLVVVLMIGICLMASTFAATRTAVVDGGDWLTPATWGGIAPVNGDEVIIPAGFTVNYTGELDADLWDDIKISGTLTITGNLDYDEWNSDTVRVLNGGTLNVGGDITFKRSNSSLDIYEGGTLNVTGDIDDGPSSNPYRVYNEGQINVANIYLDLSTLINTATGNIEITGLLDGGNAEAFDNYGFVEITGGVNTFRTINNFSTGTILIHGSWVGNNDDLINDGLIVVNQDFYLDKTDLINSSTGRLLVFGDLTVGNGASYDNEGLVQVNNFTYVGGAGGFDNDPGTLVVLEKFDVNWTGCPCGRGDFYYGSLEFDNPGAASCGSACSDYWAEGDQIEPGRKLWVKSDFIGSISGIDGDEVGSWFDMANSYGFDLSQSISANSPVFRDNASDNINYNPVVDFGTSSDDLFLEMSQNLFVTAANVGQTIFSVSVPEDGGSTSGFVYDFGDATTDGYGLSIGEDDVNYYSATGHGGANSLVSSTGNGASPLIATSEIEFGVEQTLFLNGSQIGNTPVTITELNDPEIDQAAGVPTVGRQANDGSNKFAGRIAELIVYETLASDTERVATQSYLGIKYGLSLPHSYLDANYDTIFHYGEGYDNSIVGLGREDVNHLHQRQSTVDDLTITTDNFVTGNQFDVTTDLTNESFILIGHDGDLFGSDRVYKVETNDNFNQSISLRFDISGLDPGDLPEIIIDDNEDFSSPITNFAPDSYASDQLIYTYASFGSAGVAQTLYFLVDASLTSPPVAIRDTLQINEDDVNQMINVVTNDTDADGDLDASTFEILSGPFNGGQTNNGSGEITYTPTADFNGLDSIQYRVADLEGSYDTSWLWIEVSQVWDATIAVDDSYTIDEDDTDASFNVLSNDSNIDLTLSGEDISIVSGPTNGTANNNLDGTINYQPNADFDGNDTIEYEICAGVGYFETGTYTGNGSTQSISGLPFEPDAVWVKGNIGDASILKVAEMPTNESKPMGPTSQTDVNSIVGITSDGFNVDVNPRANSTGIDYYYLAIKNVPGFVATGTYIGDGGTTEITSPGFEPDFVVVMAEEGQASYFRTSDFGGNNSTHFRNSGITQSNRVENFTSNGFYVGPNSEANESGKTYYYLAIKEGAGVDIGTYIGTGVDGASVSTSLDPDFLLVKPDDGNSAHFKFAEQSAALAFNYNQTESVDHIKSFGTNEFTVGVDPSCCNTNSATYYYMATQNAIEEYCDQAYLIFTVDPIDDAPVATTETLVLDEDDPNVTVDLTDNISDVDGNRDLTNITILTSTDLGSFTDNNDGTFTFDVAADSNGVDTLLYEACDLSTPTPLCDTDTIFLTVNQVWDEMDATDDAETMDEDDSATAFDVLSNDSNIDFYLEGEDITITSLPSNGTVSNNYDGTLSYTPDPDYNGNDTVGYQVCGSAGHFYSGVYVGNGSTQSISGLGFKPDIVLLKGDNIDLSVVKTEEMSDAESKTIPGDVANETNLISSFDLDGFSVGGNNRVNDNAVNYYYLAIKDVKGYVYTGTYTGDGASGRVISGLGFKPDMVIVLPEDAEAATLSMSDFPNGNSSWFGDFALNGLNRITSFRNDGFELGNDIQVNDNLKTYHFIALRDADMVETGSYTGNGVDSESISTSFDPEFVMVKPSTATAAHFRFKDQPMDESLPSNLDTRTNRLESFGTNEFTLGSSGVCCNANAITNYYIATKNDVVSKCDIAELVITVNPVDDAPVATTETLTLDEDDPNVTVDLTDNISDVDGNRDLTNITILTATDLGSFTDNDDGTFTFDVAADSNGVDTLLYEACDLSTPTPLCDTDTIFLTVNPVDDDPVTVNDTLRINEDDPVASIDVASNDSDIDGDLDPSSVNVQVDGILGSAVAGSAGELDYTASADQNGTDVITYEVCDGNGNCVNGTLVVIISAVDDAPVATTETLTLDEDDPNVTVDLTDNISDVDGNRDLTNITILTTTDLGSFTDNNDGTFTFDVAADSNGVDTLLYEACDLSTPTPLCDTDTIFLTVNPVDDDPVTVNDTLRINEDDPVASIDVASNDSDIDGDLDPSSVNVQVNGTLGSAVAGSPGELDYTVSADQNGTDVITYEVCDGNGNCVNGTLVVIISAVDDAPVATTETLTLDEDDPNVTVDLTDNISDVDGNRDLTNITILTTTDLGSFTDNNDGTFTFDVAADSNGVDTLLYEACDLSTPTPLCDADTIFLVVNPVADAPFTQADFPVTTQGNDITVNVVANDSDVDGDLDPTSVSIIVGAVSGVSIVNNGDGTLELEYSGTPSYNEIDTIIYEVCDLTNPIPLCSQDTIFASVGAGNPPVAVNDTVTIDEDSSGVSVTVSLNDTDPDNNLDTTSTTILVNGNVGVGSVNVDGTVTYIPGTNENGIDSLEYRICDSVGLCGTAWLYIEIMPVADTPIAIKDEPSCILENSGMNSFDVLSNDTDVENDINPSLTSVIVGPSNGTFTVGTMGTIDYKPDTNWNGMDTIVYQIEDSTGLIDSDSLIICVDPVDYSPVAINDTIQIDEDYGDTTFSVLANDFDLDNDLDTSSLTITVLPNLGSAIIVTDGMVTYSSDKDSNGVDSFTYEICDSRADCISGLVVVEITPVADTPDVVLDTISTDEDVLVNIDVVANDSDVDGNLDVSSINIVVGGLNGTAIANVDGTIDYTPNSDWNGEDTVVYQVCDLTSLCSFDTLFVTVNPIADPPVAVQDNGSTYAGSAVSITLYNNDYDPDNDIDTSTYAIIGGTTNLGISALEVSPGIFSFRYDADSSVTGNDFAVYQVFDETGLSDTDTIFITISEVPVYAILDSTSMTQGCQSLTFDVLANDNFPSAIDKSTFAVLDVASNVTYSETLGEVTLSYESLTVFPLFDTLTYRVCDIGAICDTGVFYVRLDSNTAPITQHDTITVYSANTDTLNILNNDFDTEGLNPLSMSILKQGMAGVGTLDSTGLMILDYSSISADGEDTLVYEVCDSLCICSTDSVFVSYIISPEFMQLNDDTMEVGAGCGYYVLDIYENDIIPTSRSESDSYLITPIDTNSNISFVDTAIVIDYSNGLLSEQTMVFEYQVCDTLGYCDTAEVFFIVGTNEAPSANDDDKIVYQNTRSSIEVLHNDTDDFGLDSFSISFPYEVTELGAELSQDSITGNILIDYTVITDSAGFDRFTYQVCDLNCLCSTAEVSLSVLPDHSLMKVYQAISPNNDGDNDYWHVHLLDLFPGNSVTIFNRWGEIVFEIDDYNNKDIVWDGTSNVGGLSVGTELPDGTYFYVIDVGVEGVEEKTGFIVLDK